MTGRVTWPGRVRRRLGPRGGAIAVLVASLLVIAVSLVGFPAVRCEVFGLGCAATPEPAAQVQDASRDGVQPLTPPQVATQGSYVGLGDSYSAGEGALATAQDRLPTNRCRRTSQSYVHAVAEAFDFAGGDEFWACSGATTADVMKGRAGEPPQIDRVDAGVSLVTISIGGNDVGFSEVLSGCVVKLPFTKGCRDQGGEIADQMAKLRRSLPDLLDTIVDRAPRARVIALGYPRMFSEVSGADGDNISVDDQRWLNQRGLELNELIRQAVAEADRRIVAGQGQGSVEFVDLYNAFAGHEVGTDDAYINGLNLNVGALTAHSESYHPTAEGYRAMAELVKKQINQGPGRPLNQYAGQ